VALPLQGPLTMRLALTFSLMRVTKMILAASWCIDVTNNTLH